MLREEQHVDADKTQPEMQLPDEFGIHVTAHFREPVIPAPTISAVVFTRNLWVGDRGDDVQALQQFLNQEGFIVAPEGYGSPGNETEDFGLRTKEALIRFQEANAVRILSPFGLTEGTGFFGSSTRAFINSLLSE